MKGRARDRWAEGGRGARMTGQTARSCEEEVRGAVYLVVVLAHFGALHLLHHHLEVALLEGQAPADEGAPLLEVHRHQLSHEERGRRRERHTHAAC